VKLFKCDTCNVLIDPKEEDYFTITEQHKFNGSTKIAICLSKHLCIDCSQLEDEVINKLTAKYIQLKGGDAMA
jgi:hypothetical protein